MLKIVSVVLAASLILSPGIAAATSVVVDFGGASDQTLLSPYVEDGFVLTPDAGGLFIADEKLDPGVLFEGDGFSFVREDGGTFSLRSLTFSAPELDGAAATASAAPVVGGGLASLVAVGATNLYLSSTGFESDSFSVIGLLGGSAVFDISDLKATVAAPTILTTMAFRAIDELRIVGAGLGDAGLLFDDFTFDLSDLGGDPIPLPGAMPLFVLGLMGAGLARRKARL